MFDYRRLAILAEGRLGVITSKTAACIIRYRPDRVACVIDSSKAGMTAGAVLGFGGAIPIVASVGEALTHSPDTLLIGIAPRGGLLPDLWREPILEAVDNGLNIISGLHTMLGADEEIGTAAAAAGVRIWDTREPIVPDGISRGLLARREGRVMLTVGSDCSSGKMTAAYEIAAFLRGRNVNAEFVPTGQTGILLAGWGVAVDRIAGDFMSRVTEDLVLEALERSRVAVVEGQGSLIHPGYSGVTLAILHGCCPDGMVLCHQASRLEIEDFRIRIPDLGALCEIHEQACRPVYPSRVVACAINTFDLDEAEARAAIEAAEEATGLPATDVVRWGCEGIAGALEGML